VGSSTSGSQEALNGYMSYTNKTAGSSEHSGNPYRQTDDERRKDRDDDPSIWMAYAAVVAGPLSLYSATLVVPGVLLGISAIILGLMFLFRKKNTLALIGVITGSVGIILSVLAGAAYVGLFNLVTDFITSSFGFGFYGGW